MDKPLKPGNVTPQSGQYLEVGPRGGNIGGGEVTSVEGHRLPPTKKPGNGYILIDPTRHKK